jgi:hypothetical protein
MTALVYTCSLLLAALMGFAVHRASLCTVKTVAEIFSSRRAYMMATLLKAVLWVVAVSVPILVFLRDVFIRVAARQFKTALAPSTNLAAPYYRKNRKSRLHE